MKDDDEVFLLWSTVDGLKYPTLRDREGRLLEPFTSYLHSVVAKTVNRARGATMVSEMEASTYALKGLAEFLIRKRRRLPKISDELLLTFRKEAHEETMNSPQGRGRSQTAAMTVNTKLRKIYDFLNSCQANRMLPNGTIGPADCRVESTLPLREKTRGKKSKDYKKYPLCFRRIGESSRNDLSQYWATEQDIRELEQYFREQAGQQAAERNVLLLRIGEYEGWRVSSSVSITTDQFSDNAMKAQDGADAFQVCPPSQKLGYQYVFSMPWPLANAIRDYIKGGRADLMSSLNQSEATACFAVFLSTTTGQPLKPKSVTQIFSNALRALDRPKWAAYHAFRRYRAQQVAEQVIEHRKRDGLSLVPHDVIDEVARLLGHASREAQRAYVRATTKMSLQSVEEQLRSKNAELQIENSALRESLNLLRQQLGAKVERERTERDSIMA
ncbi:hypothetical protein PQR75_05295 [Paraburkholderia fungorum]|uniref:hypothetical protein n=1 Tax=Paraburkholderia fungorum TaxID=134537 RepID=UPI0038B846F6